MLTKVKPVVPTVEQCVERFTDRMCFISKELRDQVYRRLNKINCCVRRRTSRGSRLHPEFIVDWPHEYETGFGNTDYQTVHRVLYHLEKLPPRMTVICPR